jgi:hypothetical protein
MRRLEIMSRVTRAEAGPTVFAAALALMYGAIPLGLYWYAGVSSYYLELAQITAVAVPCVVLSSRLGVLDPLVRSRAKITVATGPFLVVVWTVFLGFVVVACITAEKIPIVAALQGADGDTLAVLRERFLKAREGWQSSFVYINLLLAGALVPYSLMLATLRRNRYRWVLFALFFVYCISFVEKVFFLKAVIPLLYVVIQHRTSTVRPRAILAAAAGVLVLVTVLSGTGDRSARPTGDEFFSTSFATRGVGEFLAWRAVAIPVVTAADTLLVFEHDFGGRPLLGASSALLAGAFGIDRVNVEREVYALQWGQNETETGNANSVYLTEAYLNFGYVGVVVFSVIIGLVLRIFARSEDEALRSLWMLFCFGALIAPLSGMLFSNGFLAILAFSLATRFRGAGAVGSRSRYAPAWGGTAALAQPGSTPARR